MYYTPYNKKNESSKELLFFLVLHYVVLVEYILNKKYFIIYITSSL